MSSRLNQTEQALLARGVPSDVALTLTAAGYTVCITSIRKIYREPRRAGCPPIYCQENPFSPIADTADDPDEAPV
jgi:hypothetical protein